MAAHEYGFPCAFDALFTRNVWHILEKIFLSLDYETYKNCVNVNKVWHDLLTSHSYQRKGKSVFHDELLEDEKKLCSASGQGDAVEVRKLLSTGMLDVDCGLTTPLSESAREGHAEVVMLLLDSGADPNKKGRCLYDVRTGKGEVMAKKRTKQGRLHGFTENIIC